MYAGLSVSVSRLGISGLKVYIKSLALSNQRRQPGNYKMSTF